MNQRLGLLFILIISMSCSNNSPGDMVVYDDNSLRLKWNKAYPDDTIDKSSVGLEWAISFLGAMLPNSPSAFITSGNFITVKPSELGLPSLGLSKLEQLHQKIKASNEYQLTGAIDMGRYVTLLIGASEHYYEITGVPPHLEDLVANYTLATEKGYVNDSGVSHEHRIIQFSEQLGLNQVFLSSETDPVTGDIYEYETVELMPNGQIRFGIFDAAGNRKNSADALHSNAGKPAKCMWCHESKIQGMFSVQNDYPGFLTYLQLQEKFISSQQTLAAQRLALQGGVDFSQTQEHTLTELLYISFMEPSAERLSLEWGMTLSEVQQLLSGLPTHTYDEFPFLGALYYRNDIEGLAPFQGLTVSSNVREPSETEVNHIE